MSESIEEYPEPSREERRAVRDRALRRHEHEDAVAMSIEELANKIAKDYGRSLELLGQFEKLESLRDELVDDLVDWWHVYGEKTLSWSPIGKPLSLDLEEAAQSFIDHVIARVKETKNGPEQDS